MTAESVTRAHVDGLREQVARHRKALETGEYEGKFGVTRAQVPALLADLDLIENELRSKADARERMANIIEQTVAQ